MELTDKEALALLAELSVNVRQSGDVDAEQFAEYNGLNSKNTARAHLDQCEREGKVRSYLVYDPDRKRQVRIWRKVAVS